MHEISTRYRAPKRRGRKAAKAKRAARATGRKRPASPAHPLVQEEGLVEDEPLHGQAKRRRLMQTAETSSETPRTSRSKKRLAPTAEQAEPGGPVRQESEPEDDRPPSASERKIAEFEELLPLSALQSPTDRSLGDYVLVHRKSLQEALNMVKCEFCKSPNMTVKVVDRKGFAEKISLTCEICHEKTFERWLSERVKDATSTRPPFAVNRAMTEAFLNLGLGHAGIRSFCVTLGMTELSRQSFDAHVKGLSDDTKRFKQCVLETAIGKIREVYELEDPSVRNSNLLDLVVTYDGTWMKRGFTSLYGIGFVIDLKTGLVIDYEILSKYCFSCLLAEKNFGIDSDEYNLWYEDHQQSGSCNHNYSGSSPAMETEAASRLWQRSMQAGFRYASVLSDGDAKTHIHLESIKPYGPDFSIKKEECINHVSKRLRTGLKKVVDDCRVKKITLGGKSKEGQLTEAVMDKLAHRYKYAIENNRDDVKAMRKAVLATIYHYSSTDSKPKHNKYCPKGENSWCFYNQAKARKQKPNSHSLMKTKINEEVFHHILPLYERLSSDELLERCKRAGTQNANESLHSVVWHKVPKDGFVSLPRLEIGVVHAVAQFNMGLQAALHLQHQVRAEPVPEASRVLAQKRDKTRVEKSTKRMSKYARKQDRKKKQAEEKKKKQREGKTYNPGGF